MRAQFNRSHHLNAEYRRHDRRFADEMARTHVEWWSIGGLQPSKVYITAPRGPRQPRPRRHQKSHGWRRHVRRMKEATRG